MEHTLPDTLRAWASQAALPNAEIARRLDISRQLVSAWVWGKTTPQGAQVTAFGRACGIDEAEIRDVVLWLADIPAASDPSETT